MTVNLAPVHTLRAIAPNLLFTDDLTVPELDDAGRMKAPSFLVRGALDLACREAGRSRKKEIESVDVIARLERLVEGRVTSRHHRP